MSLAAPEPAHERRRMPLSLKFALAFLGLVSLVLIVNGAVNLWLSYNEAKRAALTVQQEKAGAAAVFRDKGDVILPIRASCSYPGLFQPVRYMNHCLVDGMISMDVPAAPLRRIELAKMRQRSHAMVRNCCADKADELSSAPV